MNVIFNHEGTPCPHGFLVRDITPSNLDIRLNCSGGYGNRNCPFFIKYLENNRGNKIGVHCGADEEVQYDRR